MSRSRSATRFRGRRSCIARARGRQRHGGAAEVRSRSAPAPAPAPTSPQLQGAAPAAACQAATPRRRSRNAGPRRSRRRSSDRGATCSVDEQAFGKAHASPSVRALRARARRRSFESAGTGPKDRILKEDVQSYVKPSLRGPQRAELPAQVSRSRQPPQVDFSQVRPDQDAAAVPHPEDLGRRNLHRNWVTIPHVTQHDEADITELEEFRKAQAEEAKKEGMRLTLLAFLMKAAVVALKKLSAVQRVARAGRREPDPEALLPHRRGSRYAERTRRAGDPRRRQEGPARARRGAGRAERTHARGQDLADGSAGRLLLDLEPGRYRRHFFTPIINAPEVAILGVGKASRNRCGTASNSSPRLHVPLSLSYDHRVIDGALGARFISFLAGLLGDIRKLML